MTDDLYYLSEERHDTAEDGLCAMEWVSYLERITEMVRY